MRLHVAAMTFSCTRLQPRGSELAKGLSAIVHTIVLWAGYLPPTAAAAAAAVEFMMNRHDSL